MRKLRLWIVLLLIAVSALAVQAAVTSKQVTVSSSPTLLVSTAGAVYENALMVNQGSVSVFLGGSAVTTSTGVEVKANASVNVSLKPNESVYGVTASSTARVDVLEHR